jgi:nodulation protein E
MNPRRVVITGIGVISALGRGARSHLDAAVAGRGAIRFIQNFDPSNLICRIGGEVPDSLMSGEHPSADRFAKFALIAAEEAVAQSRPESDPQRTAVLFGTGMGGTTTLESSYERLFGAGQTRMPPMTIPKAMYNAATSAIASRFGATGPGYTVVSACASANHAIGQAAHWIRSGLCDTAITGGSDAPLMPGIIRGWEALRVLASDDGDPSTACKPFSVDRRGLSLGEGAGAFVLETYESAVRRDAEILGEIAGFGLSMDGGHLTDPTVEGPLRAMEGAVRDAGASVDEVDYVNAHGTATKANDPTETAALHRLLGARAGRVPVSSTKAMHGHAMGASGAIELALALAALNSGTIPATLNWRGGDPECDLDYVPNEPRAGAVRFFLSNSFGFGGMNAVLAVHTARGVE